MENLTKENYDWTTHPITVWQKTTISNWIFDFSKANRLLDADLNQFPEDLKNIIIKYDLNKNTNTYNYLMNKLNNDYIEFKKKTEKYLKNRKEIESIKRKKFKVHRTNGARIFNPLTNLSRRFRILFKPPNGTLYQIDSANSQIILLGKKFEKSGKFKIEKELLQKIYNGEFYEIFMDLDDKDLETFTQYLIHWVHINPSKINLFEQINKEKVRKIKKAYVDYLKVNSELKVKKGQYKDKYIQELGFFLAWLRQNWNKFNHSKEFRDLIKGATYSVIFSSKELITNLTDFINNVNPITRFLKDKYPKFVESLILYTDGDDTNENLSKKLQREESRIWIDKISSDLTKLQIPHLTIHDSVVFPAENNDDINLVHNVILKGFNYKNTPLHIEYFVSGENVKDYEFKKVNLEIPNYFDEKLFREEEYENLINDISEYGWDPQLKKKSVEFLSKNLDIYKNEIDETYYYKGRQMTDEMENGIYGRYVDLFNKGANKKELFNFLYSEENKNMLIMNPFKEHINKLKEKYTYEEVKGNIDELLDCIEENDQVMPEYYKKLYVRKWLVSIINSIYGDIFNNEFNNNINQLMLVLISREQGTYKTTFFRYLLPYDLRKYYSETPLKNLHDKDQQQYMFSKLLISDDEFTGGTKNDAEQVKSILTKKIIDIRLPYARNTIYKRRLATYCGTSNHEEILNDTTGNRRIIPLIINNINIEKFKKLDKNKLFLEMYYEWYDHEGITWLTKEDEMLLSEFTGFDDTFQMNMNNYLTDFFVETNGANNEFMTLDQIERYFKKNEIDCRYNRVSLGRIFKSKFKQTLKYINGKRTRVYLIKPVDMIGDSFNLNQKEIEFKSINQELNEINGLFKKNYESYLKKEDVDFYKDKSEKLKDNNKSNEIYIEPKKIVDLDEILKDL